MPILIGNAPCSWGVEFADDPRNPAWQRVLDEGVAAGYRGMELGPIGFMPEDPNVLGPALAERGITLIGGVIFRPFHDPAAWEEVLDASVRTCRAIRAHGARHAVLIDSIAPRRAQTAGRGAEAERMVGAELQGFLGRLRHVAKMATEEYGLTCSIHSHAGGFVDFEDEVETVLSEIAPELLGICLDTGHMTFAGIDPIGFYRRHAGRVSYLHLKDIDPAVMKKTIAERTDYYQACANGLFCRLGEGIVDFIAFRSALEQSGYSGWATVEQDCDPAGRTSPLDDATRNFAYLKSVGLA